MLIFDPTTDPFFNLAADEFLLREVSEPVLRIWRSSPCVVVGRHQIPCVEVNVVAAFRRGVPILRRLSGGGAVYHDFGNVNFTIVAPVTKGQGIDFARMLAPIAAALNAMGVAAEYAGRGDLRLNGKKISGNSAYLWKGRVLHHGTLLYDADLDALEALLDVCVEGITGKSVRSARSVVTNLHDSDPRHGDAPGFAAAFLNKLAPLLGFDPSSAREFSPAENLRIKEIARMTYATNEWNLGASPDYSIERRDFDGHAMKFAVENGRVASVEIEGDDNLAAELRGALSGVWHEPDAIENALARVKVQYASCPPLEAFYFHFG